MAALSLVLTACTLPPPTRVPEIANYRLTSVDGFVELRARLESDTIESGGNETDQEEVVFQEEVGLHTTSYVYHPNFLFMDLTGSVLFDQRRFELNSSSTSDQRATWNLSADLSFLRKKPYPFTLFFRRDNPLISTGLTGSFIQENSRYGIRASLLEPLSPVRVDLEISRTTEEGRGFEQIVDETRDQFILSATHSFWEKDETRVSYEINRRQSASGSVGLPIRATDTTDHIIDALTNATFGDEDQFRLTNIVTFGSFENPSRTDLRISPYFRWRHSEILDSFYRYNLFRIEQDSGDSLSQSAIVGVNVVPAKDLQISADVHGEDNDEAAASRNRRYGATGSVFYSRPIPIGRLGLSHSVTYDRVEQESQAALVSVTGERLTLTGLTAVPLANDFVIASSVRVSNDARTQTFVEGADYRLVVVGAETSVQRLATGAILDGQVVLVDYSFETGGSFDYNELRHNHRVDLSFARYYNAFFRYAQSDISVTSGVPTTPLNPFDLYEVGAYFDRPLFARFTVGGRATYLSRDEDIAPSDRTYLDAYLQMTLPLRSWLRVSARREWVDQERSGEDVDLTGFAVQLRSRPLYRLSLSADFDYEEDTGGTLPREITRALIRAAWGIRRLMVDAEARYGEERQGTSTRDDLSVRVTVRRDFP